MEKENLMFSSKTPKLEILIKTCLIKIIHYGRFQQGLSINCQILKLDLEEENVEINLDAMYLDSYGL